MKKILKYFLNYYRCGFEQDVFAENAVEIAQINQKMLKTLNSLSLFISGILFFLSFFFSFIHSLMPVYLGLFVTAGIIQILGIRKKNSARMNLFLIYIEIVILLIIGFYLGIRDVGNNAATICVFLVVLPLFVIDRPIRIQLIFILTAVLFILSSFRVKEGELAVYDTVNIIVFCVIGLYLQIFTMHTKLSDSIMKKQLKHQRDYDSLTKVYNRGAMEERINKHLKINRGALLLIDIDNFKQINDTFGHGKGDLVLEETATILKTQFRELNLVGRMGGDEFIVFIPGMENISWLCAKADRLVNELTRIMSVEEMKFKLSASIGIAIADKEDQEYESLYRKADNAMYQAKKAGKAGFGIYGFGSCAYRKLILLVDDSEMARIKIGNILKDEYEILESGSVDEAEIIIRKRKEELSAVLLDQMMPGRSGLELLEMMMKGDSEYKQIPVIMVSADQDTETKIQALSLGARYFIEKPVNREVLCKLLHNIAR